MALKRLGKKGIFYTLIAMGLMGLIIYSFTMSFAPKMQQRAQITESIVFAMDSFFEDITKDMERAAYISSFRAILSMEESVFATGKFIGNGTPSLEQAFEELFFNGTMGGANYVLMENNTFLNWTDKMMSMANELYIVMNYSIDDFDLYQDNPWSIKVGLNLTIDLKDRLDTARFTRSIFAIAEVDIDEFNDPFYVVKTNQARLIKFRRSPYERLFNESNLTNLELHVNNSYYLASPDAPSFLDRFKGELDSSGYGIESFINKQVMGDLASSECAYGDGLGYNLHNRTLLDYLYCNATLNLKNYTVTGMPDWFLIDNVIIIYNSTYNLSRHVMYAVENISVENK